MIRNLVETLEYGLREVAGSVLDCRNDVLRSSFQKLAKLNISELFRSYLFMRDEVPIELETKISAAHFLGVFQVLLHDLDSEILENRNRNSEGPA